MQDDASITLFRQACGATEPLTFRVDDARTRRVVCEVRDEPFLLIGRDPRADLCLDAPEVSRRHAYLQVIDGRAFCFDLQSRTGLRWEQGTAPFGWLDPAQAVGIGPFAVRLLSGVSEGPGAAWDPLAAVPAGDDNLPGMVIEGGGRAAAVVWRMNSVLAFVGLAAECRVRIPGNVSRIRCALVRTPAGTWLVDLLGRPDVLVNDAPARWALLGDGHRVRVGSVSLRARYDARPDPRPALPLDSGGTESDPITPGEPGVFSLVEAPLPHLVPAHPSDRQALLRRGPSALAAPGGVDVPAWLLPLTSQFAQMQQQMFDQFAQVLLMMGQMYGQLHREQMALVREELQGLQRVAGDLRLLQAELAQHEGGASGWTPTNGFPPDAQTAPGDTGQAPAAGQDRPRAPVPPPPPPPVPAVGLSQEDVHARLCRRIQELQQERETRWQKFLNALLGKRPAGG
jgi:hypothetical protein